MRLNPYLRSDTTINRWSVPVNVDIPLPNVSLHSPAPESLLPPVKIGGISFQKGAGVIGVSISGNGPQTATQGFELLEFGNNTHALYTFKGPVHQLGDGVNASVYVGMVTNVSQPSDYSGPAFSDGFTLSMGHGVTAFISQGTTGTDVKGLFIGWAPGAKFSWWHADAWYDQLLPPP